jgi:hypothetical protein
MPEQGGADQGSWSKNKLLCCGGIFWMATLMRHGSPLRQVMLDSLTVGCQPTLNRKALPLP